MFEDVLLFFLFFYCRAAAPMKGRFGFLFFFFFKLDTFIIHVKEITVKFNLGEVAAPV